MTGELVANEARSLGHRHVVYIPNKDDVTDYLSEILHKGDMVITMGAGDIWKIGEDLMERLQ